MPMIYPAEQRAEDSHRRQVTTHLWLTGLPPLSTGYKEEVLRRCFADALDRVVDRWGFGSPVPPEVKRLPAALVAELQDVINDVKLNPDVYSGGVLQDTLQAQLRGRVEYDTGVRLPPAEVDILMEAVRGAHRQLEEQERTVIAQRQAGALAG